VKVVEIQVCVQTHQSTLTLRSQLILFGQLSPVTVTSEHMFMYLLVMCFVGTEWGKRVFDGVGHDVY